MHTLMVLSTAFALLVACVVIGRLAGGRAGMARGCLAFVPLWFLGAGINMAIGVVSAGYSVADEAPIFLVVFGVPAAVALLVRRGLS